MAGHRRARGPAAGQEEIRSPALVVRAENIEGTHRGKYAEAQSPRERLIVSTNYALSAEAAAYRAGVDVEELIGAHARDLMRLGDALADALRKRGRGMARSRVV